MEDNYTIERVSVNVNIRPLAVVNIGLFGAFALASQQALSGGLLAGFS